MTAPTTPQPVCPNCGHRLAHHVSVGGCCIGACLCLTPRTTAPPEPPAGACPSALQGSTALIPCSHPAGHPPLDDGVGRYWAHGKGTLHWDRLPAPPAETQQDDERAQIELLLIRNGVWPLAVAERCATALAARPSADAEALRRVRELAEAWQNRLAPPGDGYASGVVVGERRCGAALAMVLRAALDAR